jgi:1,4-dihydroxy-6-naphthoate synthase
VIIHENRFTYHLKGLHKLMDLGDYWEKETGVPIPLGGIVTKRVLEKNIIEEVDTLIKQSVEYAYKNNYEKLSTYVKEHSQELSEQIMRQHIDLYVNNYSIALGEDGKKTVLKLVEIYHELHPLVNTKMNEIF